MAKKQPEKIRKKILTKEVLAFVVVVLAVTGYLLYQGATKPPATAGPTAAPAAPDQGLVAGNTLPVVPLISLNGNSLLRSKWTEKSIRYTGGQGASVERHSH